MRACARLFARLSPDGIHLLRNFYTALIAMYTLHLADFYTSLIALHEVQERSTATPTEKGILRQLKCHGCADKQSR